jgi:hypothetical protein
MPDHRPDPDRPAAAPGIPAPEVPYPVFLGSAAAGPASDDPQEAEGLLRRLKKRKRKRLGRNAG